MTVQPGQTWAHTCHLGRTVKVDGIADGKAACTETTNSNEVQAYLDQVHGGPAPIGMYYGDKRGTTSFIALTTLARKEWVLRQDAESQSVT